MDGGDDGVKVSDGRSTGSMYSSLRCISEQMERLGSTG